MKKFKMLMAALVVFLFSSIAYSSVVYHDIVPDTTLQCVINLGVKYAIDITNSGVESILFNMDYNTISGTFHKVEVVAENTTELLCQKIDNGYYPLALNAGDAINQNGVWYDCFYGYEYINLNYNSERGNWIGVNDKYLPFRIKQGNGYIYGWIRLDIPANAESYTVKDYAYESELNKEIIAGTGVDGVKDSNNWGLTNQVQIYPNPANNFVTIKGLSSDCSNCKIYDLLGNCVVDEQNPANSKINVEQLLPGLYVIICNDASNNYKLMMIKE